MIQSHPESQISAREQDFIDQISPDFLNPSPFSYRPKLPHERLERSPYYN